MPPSFARASAGHSSIVRRVSTAAARPVCGQSYIACSVSRLLAHINGAMKSIPAHKVRPRDAPSDEFLARAVGGIISAPELAEGATSRGHSAAVEVTLPQKWTIGATFGDSQLVCLRNEVTRVAEMPVAFCTMACAAQEFWWVTTHPESQGCARGLRLLSIATSTQ